MHEILFEHLQRANSFASTQKINFSDSNSSVFLELSHVLFSKHFNLYNDHVTKKSPLDESMCSLLFINGVLLGVWWIVCWDVTLTTKC